MIEAPQIMQTPARRTAFIHLTVPWDEMPNVMGPGISELTTVIADQGIAPTGPWFTHHLRGLTHTFDFEISVPVAAPVTAAGRVQPGEWPAIQVARTTYRGNYEGLSDAWGEFMDWIETNGYLTTSDFYECYVAGPESSQDPANWRTELTRPLKH